MSIIPMDEIWSRELNKFSIKNNPKILNIALLYREYILKYTNGTDTQYFVSSWIDEFCIFLKCLRFNNSVSIFLS